VLELGAGTCWLSHFLNRYGCKTVSVDVSETALDLGRQLFERDNQTRWDLEPEFIAYDGHTIPLPDGSCDKIVINDAFHHLPNPEEILREMARLLPRGGIVAMSEPGPGHAVSEESLREVRETGVLENEIVLSELHETALRAGFTEVALVPLALESIQEIPVETLGKAGEAEAILDQWLRLGRATRYIVLHKGPWFPNTKAPGELDARIDLSVPADGVRVEAGSAHTVRVRVANQGGTRWLATLVERRGWTRLGVHLYRAVDGEGGEPTGELVDFDWLRVSLPSDMEPGDEETIEVELPPIEEPGTYRLVFDLVAEGVLWFAQKDSPTTDLTLEVHPA
jgi:SAM-dependent methyltransferase